jgi:hypothetical protein
VAVTIRCLLTSPRQVAGMLYGLQLACEAQLREGRYPPLYRSGVRYVEEPMGRENWQIPSVTLQLRSGDCEDLASWRAAELVVSGEDRRARAVVKIVRPGLMHCIVLRGNGQREDPSKVLGMRGKG